MRTKSGTTHNSRLSLSLLIFCLIATSAMAEDATEYVAQGKALQQKGQTRDGIPDFRTAVRLNPNNAEAQYALAESLVNANNVRHGTTTYGHEPTKAQLEEAIQHFRKAIHLQPANADWENSLGLCLANSGRYREAIIHDRRAISLLPPTSPMESNQIGSAIVRERARENEMAIFQQHTRERATTLFYMRSELADALLRSGQSKASIPFYRAALSVQPDSPWVLSGLADALNRSGKRREARTIWKKVIHIDKGVGYYSHQARISLRRYTV